MKFRDLKQQYARIQERLATAMQQVLTSTCFISGPSVTELEEQLAEYVGRRHCIVCGNGTDALVLALRAWGIGPGDAVFVPDFTFFASAECVSAVGGTPIFVDVLPATFNIDENALEVAINQVLKEKNLRPAAIISVDLFGLPANYLAIQKVAQQYNLCLLEDAAQGFGGRIGNQRACCFGHAATTSFFPAKPLGCYGDGGAVFTDDNEMAALVRSLAVHGKGVDKYDNVRVGYNSRLDTLQAAVLLCKMEIFDDEVLAVNRVAARYTENLQNAVIVPVVPEGFSSSWAQYTIRLQNETQRKKVQAAFADYDIPSMIYYNRGMHQMKAFFDILPLQVDNCVESEKLTKTVLSLPCHPYLSNAEIDKVCCTIINAIKP